MISPNVVYGAKGRNCCSVDILLKAKKDCSSVLNSGLSATTFDVYKLIIVFNLLELTVSEKASGAGVCPPLCFL
jgi:hypothetical protein